MSEEAPEQPETLAAEEELAQPETEAPTEDADNKEEPPPSSEQEQPPPAKEGEEALVIETVVETQNVEPLDEETGDVKPETTEPDDGAQGRTAQIDENVQVFPEEETRRTPRGTLDSLMIRMSVDSQATDRRASQQRSSLSKGDRKMSSRARIVLGSMIDIKYQLTGDQFDKRTARYMNSYKLEANNPFNPEKVEKVLKEVLTEAMENLVYDPQACSKQAKWASSTIRGKVKQMEFDRYKIVCLVSIGEKNSQDVLATCRFLWDVEKDRFSTYTLEKTTVYGIACCFGLYYE